MRLFNLFNGRTIAVLVISQLAAFLAIYYEIKFNVDWVLFSLAIAFPLAFSTQAAFRRRDRALEYFSLFKGGAIALYNSFRISEDLSEDKQAQIRKILNGMSDQLIHQLEHRESSYKRMQHAADKVLAFIEKNRKDISNRNVLHMIRYMRDVTVSSAYLISLVKHRTMIGIRFYAIAFIFVFPILQAPILYARFGHILPSWTIHIILAFTSLTLVTLSNFQKMIEYPFDSKGMDNVRVRDFSLDIPE